MILTSPTAVHTEGSTPIYYNKVKINILWTDNTASTWHCEVHRAVPSYKQTARETGFGDRKKVRFMVQYPQALCSRAHVMKT